ncbi:protein rolling stone-like [Amphiura filiformis]|uniref:protein rolling stone-like n=1 Tax=Amphiura filiformis TaxID=82378 RepID=UPI003B21CEB4
MGSCCCRPRSRIQWSDLLLDHKDPKLFTKSQWFDSSGYFLAYRVLVSCYFLAWLTILCVIRIPDRGSRTFIYLSEWSFIILNCYFLAAALGALFYTHKEYQQAQRRSEDSEPERTSPLLPSSDTANTSTNRLPIYLRISWCLFSISTGACTMITMIYWPILFSAKDTTKISLASEFNVHLVSTVLLFVDLCISAFPLRAIHFVYPFIYGMIYVLFSVIYWAAGGVTQSGKTAIYPILDWEDKPLETVGFLLLACVLGALGYAIFYGAYRLRVKIFSRYFRRNEPGNQQVTDYNEV